MEAVKQHKKKSGKKWIVLIVIVVIIAGLFAACMGIRKAAQAKLAEMNAMQTAEVTFRPLTKSIGATGNLTSVQSRDLITTLSGMEVEQVYVEVGNTVEKGQPLVQFNTADVSKNLAAAQNALEQTEGQFGLSAENAQRQVEDAIRGGEYSIEMAQKSVDTAYQAYLDAWDALDTAQEAEETARETLENAEEKHKEAKKQLKEAEQGEGDNILDYAALQVTVYQLEQTLPQLESAVKQAEAAVTQAEKAIDTLYDQYEIAQMNYENTIASADSTVAAAQAAQNSAELSANTDQQRLQVDALADQVEKGTVVAPFDGVITAVNVKQGDTYLQGVIVTVQDCSSYEIEAEVGEYDIPDIKLGQKVLIKTEATREQELEGTVVFVSPTATAADMMSGMQMSTSTDPTYEIRISVDTPSDRLRLDMTASLSIIIEERERALTVPYNAVQTAEDGSHFVEVVGEDESLTVIPVTVVTESNYYTEIAGDLKEGDVVRVVEQKGSDMFSVMSDLSGGF